MVDKRFEALHREMDTRFTALHERLVQWKKAVRLGLLTPFVRLLGIWEK